jgi:hypothetical protein
MAQLPVTIVNRHNDNNKLYRYKTEPTEAVMVHLITICADSHIIGVSWIRI